jgi:hypothetical protein
VDVIIFSTVAAVDMKILQTFLWNHLAYLYLVPCDGVSTWEQEEDREAEACWVNTQPACAFPLFIEVWKSYLSGIARLIKSGIYNVKNTQRIYSTSNKF